MMPLRLVELFGPLQGRILNTVAQRRNRHSLICHDGPFQGTLSHRPTTAPARKLIRSSYPGSRMDDDLSIEPLQSNVASHSKDNVARFQAASLWKARWQVINSFVPYALLWFAMDRALAVSYWLMFPIAILAAGFLVRIFIIFHDCGHGSFFRSQRANNATGAIAGLVLLTPYRHWRWQHALHHGTAGDLDRRGSGDIWTLTVQEYLQSTRWRRFSYQLARNPIVLFAIPPLFVFVVQHRFASSNAPKLERRSV